MSPSRHSRFFRSSYLQRRFNVPFRGPVRLGCKRLLLPGEEKLAHGRHGGDCRCKCCPHCIVSRRAIRICYIDVAFPHLAGDWYITIRSIRRNIHEKNRTQLQIAVLRSFIAAMAPSLLSTPLEEQFPSSLRTLLSTAHPAPDVEELYDVSVRTAYEDSISFLERAWRASFNECVGIWWYIMPNTFFRLLTEGRPRALIILAHYCVMMKHVTQDGPWWAKKQWGTEAARIGLYA